MPAAAPPLQLSTAMPKPEAATGQPGTQPLAAPADHEHPRLTSVTSVTLDASGLAAVTYTRSFSKAPGFAFVPVNPSGRAVQVEVVSDTKDANGAFIGCVIHGYRSQLLPALTGVVLVGPVVAGISNFDVLGGSASGVEVRVTAIQRSD